MQFFKLHNSAIRSFLFILSLFIVIMASVINIYIAIYNPSGYFLVNEKDGKWIRFRQSIWLGINKNTESNKEIYRTGLELSKLFLRESIFISRPLELQQYSLTMSAFIKIINLSGIGIELWPSIWPHLY